MTLTPSPLPLRDLLFAAYRDAFADFRGFIKIIAVVWLGILLLVDLPTLTLADNMRRGVAQELLRKVEADTASEVKDADKVLSPEIMEKLTREDIQKLITPEFMFMNMGLSLLQALLLFSFVVAWYRQLLLSEKKGQPIMPRFGSMEWDYGWTTMKVGFVLLPIVLIMLGYLMAGLPKAFGGEGLEDLSKSLPLFAAGGLLLAYLQARFTMAYPLTVMGKKERVLKDSWRMTAGNGLQLMLGNIVVLLPVVIVTGVVMVGAAAAIHHLGIKLQGLTVETSTDVFVANVVLRALSGFFTLAAMAVLTAFHARIYAYCVRSNT